MITIAAGRDAPLVFPVTAVDPVLTIAPAGGDAPVVGPTTDGVGAAPGRCTYVWSVPAGQPAGTYVATVAGTGSGLVESNVTITVTADPVYIGLAELSESMGLTNSDSALLVARSLTAAARSIDSGTGRRPGGFGLDPEPVARVYRTRHRVVRDDDGERLLIDEIGAVDELVVEVGSGSRWTVIDPNAYETDPDNAVADRRPVSGLLRVDGLWSGDIRQRVRVTARWGWPAVPDVVVEATQLLAARLHKRRSSPDGVAGVGEWGPVRVSRTDPDIQKLINDLVLPGFG